MKWEASLFNIVWTHHDENPALYAALGGFVSERIWGKVREFDVGRAMAVIRGNDVIASVFYTNYDPDCGIIEMSGASDNPRWLTKPVLKEMFEFPFVKLGCQAVVMNVDAANARLSSILERFGFKRYEVPRLRGRNKTGVIFILSDDAWRANGFYKDTRHEQA
jgi:RimJ/RimL family protein N-acetyltransferase